MDTTVVPIYCHFVLSPPLVAFHSKLVYLTDTYSLHHVSSFSLLSRGSAALSLCFYLVCGRQTFQSGSFTSFHFWLCITEIGLYIFIVILLQYTFIFRFCHILKAFQIFPDTEMYWFCSASFDSPSLLYIFHFLFVTSCLTLFPIPSHNVFSFSR